MKFQTHTAPTGVRTTNLLVGICSLFPLYHFTIFGSKMRFTNLCVCSCMSHVVTLTVCRSCGNRASDKSFLIMQALNSYLHAQNQ